MKVLILAGGLGTRISEETEVRPKPMVEIGGKPILWHIMQHYSNFGFNDFVILLGYKGNIIKEYFAHYFLYQSDVTFDLKNNSVEYHKNSAEPWKVTLVDTGVDTMTGGRIKRVKNFITGEPFMLTYGDGISDVDLNKLLKFHKKHGKLITMTTVQPEGRYGSLDLNANGQINSFIEKPKGDGAWINAGFFVCEPGILNYIKGDEDIFEKAPLEKMVKDKKVFAYKHDGFWRCMDTLRDKVVLNQIWNSAKAPWMINK
ncbi:MAG: glucose-1-phosphate cytidylyltransferase [Candidatus Margulisbacteria bacterium]|nr:glucose-1-phosphate cytidylyltransferase [Candidatus Margulisiibacteriota bacterium]